jgi:hypothetical protein
VDIEYVGFVVRRLPRREILLLSCLLSQLSPPCFGLQPSDRYRCGVLYSIDRSIVTYRCRSNIRVTELESLVVAPSRAGQQEFRVFKVVGAGLEGTAGSFKRLFGDILYEVQ